MVPPLAARALRMSGMFGWIGHPDRAPAEVIDAMATALSRTDDGSALRTASNSAGGIGIACRRHQGDVYVGDEMLVAVSGRPRLTNSDLADLAKRHGAAHAIAAGYARDGARVLASVSGSFTLGFIDARRDEALLATDRMGTGSLFYEFIAGKLAFASTLDAL